MGGQVILRYRMSRKVFISPSHLINSLGWYGMLDGKTFAVRIFKHPGSIVFKLPMVLLRRLMPLLFPILCVHGWDQGEVSEGLTSSAKFKEVPKNSVIKIYNI